ncbi:probable integral membrane protein NMA1898 [hydrothermal vent metagenome]|uniref:Probable integral membrane protein NMA1898 n=1 Tax=hydrothermal vent metagenome TaxID=652676 RepID=A0A1W1EIG9_9ZZZZ
MITHPKFAVVGHPNKGKSTIVSSLALDDTINISDVSGTTKESRSFPLKVDGKIIYELFDTPGFQRAKSLLRWLNSHTVSAHQKDTVVKDFISANKSNPKYRDEIELLTPIMNGASIIYVVDGSKPYTSEYEAQMEILRWTSQPSMALINLIGEDNFIDEWQKALGQYFRLVRVYNPMNANFKTHLNILKSISHLKEEWIEPMEKSIEIFKNHHQQKNDSTINLITDTMVDILRFKTSYKIESKKPSKNEMDRFLKDYKKRIILKEKEFQNQINRIWNHSNIEKNEFLINLNNISLFSKKSKSIFGLNQKEVLGSGMMGGVLAGGSIDMLFGGSTLLVGSVVGALVGGVSAMVGFGKLVDVEVLGQKIGKVEILLGNIKDINFSFIILSRLLYYTSIISSHSHGMRKRIEFVDNELNIFDKDDKKIIEKIHKKLQNRRFLRDTLIEEYREIIEKLYNKKL